MDKDFLSNYILIDAIDDANPDYGILATLVAMGAAYALTGPIAAAATGLLGSAFVKSRWAEQDRIEADVKAGRIQEYYEQLPDKDKEQLNKLMKKGAINDTRKEYVPYRPLQLDPDAPHFLLLAGTREGKSNTLNCLLSRAKRVNYVSTKMTDNVPAHWNGYLLQGSDRIAQMSQLIDDWGARLSLHASNPGLPAEWFVFDESIQMRSYAKQANKKLADELSNLQIEIATQGAAIGCYVAMLAQTKNAGPLGIDLDLLQQNFQIVVPLKNKRRAGISALQKIAGISLSAQEQLAIKNNSNEYLQLWVTHDEEVFFEKLPEFKGNLKPLIPYPLEEDREDGQDDIEAKIISWLKEHPGEYTVATIKTSIRPLKEWAKNEVEDLLLTMASEGSIGLDQEKFFVESDE